MKKLTAAALLLLILVSCTTTKPARKSESGTPQEDITLRSNDPKEIKGSGENGRVLHKDYYYQNVRPGDWQMTLGGRKLSKPYYIKQADIDASQKEIDALNKLLLDESPGSVRSMLEELFDDNVVLPGEPTPPEEVDYNFIHGKVIEYINDIRGGRQTIIIVTAIENKKLFSSLYTTPPWLNEQADIPPDEIAFTLMKKVNSTENRIFCLNEDLQSTKKILKTIKEAKTQPQKPAKAARKPVIGPFLKNLWDQISDDIWYGGRSEVSIGYPLFDIGLGADIGNKWGYVFLDILPALYIYQTDVNDNNVGRFIIEGGIGIMPFYWFDVDFNILSDINCELRWYTLDNTLITEFRTVFLFDTSYGRLGCAVGFGGGKDTFTYTLGGVYRIGSKDF